MGNTSCKKDKSSKRAVQSNMILPSESRNCQGKPLVVHPLLRSQTAVAEVLELVDPLAPGLPGEGMK